MPVYKSSPGRVRRGSLALRQREKQRGGFRNAKPESQGGVEARQWEKSARMAARRVGAGAASVGGVQNRVEHDVGEDWRWTPMVCEGPGDFLDARWPVDDGGVVKTQLTRFGVMTGAVLRRLPTVNFSTPLRR